jgi:hypothetical protein
MRFLGRRHHISAIGCKELTSCRIAHGPRGGCRITTFKEKNWRPKRLRLQMLIVRNKQKINDLYLFDQMIEGNYHKRSKKDGNK